MRGGEGKHVTVHVYDIIGGGVLFKILFDYYPEYEVEDVYTKLTEEIKKEFEEYHSKVVGGANKVNHTLKSVINDKQKILADIEIYANNPSIKIAGKYTLPDGTIVTYKGLYEQIPKHIKEYKNKDINDIKEAYVDAIVKRVELRETPQVSSMQSQPKIPPLKFDSKSSDNSVPIEKRTINKGTSKIYNTSGGIIIGENGRVKTDENGHIKEDLFEVPNLASKLKQSDNNIEMTVYVK